MATALRAKGQEPGVLESHRIHNTISRQNNFGRTATAFAACIPPYPIPVIKFFNIWKNFNKLVRTTNFLTPKCLTLCRQKPICCSPWS